MKGKRHDQHLLQEINLTALGRGDTGKERARSDSYHTILEELMRSEGQVGELVGGVEWFKTIHALVTYPVILQSTMAQTTAPVCTQNIRYYGLFSKS